MDAIDAGPSTLVLTFPLIITERDIMCRVAGCSGGRMRRKVCVTIVGTGVMRNDLVDDNLIQHILDAEVEISLMPFALGSSINHVRWYSLSEVG